MILEGDMSVVEALKEKKRLMEAGKSHDHLKILMICDGGLIKGAYSVGVGLALEELGYISVFSDVVGVSSGAPSVAYFLAGSVHTGGSLIYEECCSKKFMNVWRFWNIVNVDYIVAVLRGATGKRLDGEKVLHSKTRIHIGVSVFDTAEPVLIVPRTEEELFDSIRASVLMPHMSRARAWIRGKRYIDGGFAYPHILHKALTTIVFTHVLILTSQNKDDNTLSRVEKFLNNTLFRHRFTKAGLFATTYRKNARREALEALAARGDVKALTMWGDGTIGGTEKESEKIKQVVQQYKEEWLNLMKK